MNKIVLGMKKLSILLIIIGNLLFVACEKNKPGLPDYTKIISISIDTITNVQHRSAKVISILEPHDYTIKSYGHCWDTLQFPDLSKNKITCSPAPKDSIRYSNSLNNLTPGKRYYVRAYFIIDDITVYSEEKSFYSLEPVLPVVETAEVSDYNSTTATAGGNISLDGGSSITVRGVCWSTSPTPDVTDSKTKDGSGTGTYVSSLTNLNINTTYYVRAYAINSIGISYGEEKVFITKDGVIQLTTIRVRGITSSGATSGGTISDDEGLAITAWGLCWSTFPEPSIDDNTTAESGEFQNFTSAMTGLSENTDYYVRAYVTNIIGVSYGNEVFFTNKTGGTFTDFRDNNSYDWIRIGDQVWMAENLRATKYSDGSVISNVEANSEWEALGNDGKAFCWYDNSISNGDTYGALYTWAAAMNGAASSDANPSGVQGVCPDHWHFPSDSEWEELEMFLGMSQDHADGFGLRGTDEGGKLKETGTINWYSPNTGASNMSGFSAIPGGCRHYEGIFKWLGMSATYWTATNYDDSEALEHYMEYDHAKISKYHTEKVYGMSVRCLKDY